MPYTFVKLELQEIGIFMKTIDERRFDFLSQKMWKSLTKKDQDNVHVYRRKFVWYRDNNDKIKSLEKELKK